MGGNTDSITIGSELWDRPNPGLLSRIALARATNDGRGLRRWIFWIWWSRPRALGDRIHAVRRVVLSPAIAIVHAARAIGRYGDKVAKQHGVSRSVQFVQLVKLQAVVGLPVVTYYMFQLFRAERWLQAEQYLVQTGTLFQALSRRLPDAPDLGIFVNKARFEQWCREYGFATVSNVCEISGETVWYQPDRSVPSVDLFSKPANAQRGEGVSRWTHLFVGEESKWTKNDGGVYSAEEIEKYLHACFLETGRPMVLQPQLKNHESIRGLGNGSLSTIRLMTIRPPGGNAEALLGVLRIPIGNAIADNFDLGGLGAPVDLESGALGPALFKRGDYPLDELLTHPDTGAQIAGAVVPYWNEAVTLAVQAHDSISAMMPVIGWDVAILEAGPVLIEANHMPGPELAQMTTGMALGATRYADCVLAHMRMAFSV